MLISNKYATLKEIRDDYSIEEVIALYESCMVNITNKQLIQDALQIQRNKKLR